MKKILILGFILLTFKLFGQGFVTNKDFIWRSALLPSWGQFYNEKLVSGFIFSGGVAGSIAGVIYTESQRTRNIRFAGETSNITLKRTFNDRATQWATRRNILGIVGLGFYIGNIIQATAMQSNIYAYQGHKLEFFVRADTLGVRFNF